MTTQDPNNASLLTRIRSILPRKNWQIALLGLFTLGAAGFVALAILSLFLVPSLPSLDAMKEGKLKVPMRVYTADNVLIGEFGEERRIPIKVDSTPPQLIHAILSAEDADFYDHYGIELLGFVRAAIANIRAGRKVQGASTITMQVARNFFLSPERSYKRKLKEVLLSLKLERDLSKNEILELYLNKIFLGHRAYGFGAAARIYYGRNLNELTLPELAMLAGLPKAPSASNPLRKKDVAFNRRNYVLSRMFQLGYLDEAIYRDAISAPLSAKKHALRYDVEAPHISEMVRRYMLEKYSDKTYAGGFHVYTTIHSEYQKAANEAVRTGLMDYDRRHGWRGVVAKRLRVDGKKITEDTDILELDKLLETYHGIGNLVPAIVRSIDEKSANVYARDGFTATIPWSGINWAARHINADAIGAKPKSTVEVIRPGDVIYIQERQGGVWHLAQAPRASAALVSVRSTDGAILALTGGFDFTRSKFNRITQAQRQAGSNIKPFVYSAALEKGFTAATIINDAPITIADENLEDFWRPENYGGKFAGPMRLREALVKSKNLVSIRILRGIGVDYAVDYLGYFGFNKSLLPRNLSLALGSASVLPIDLVTGYAAFSNGGFKVTPYFITRIEDGQHNILEQANPAIVCHSCPQTLKTEMALQELNPNAAADSNPADTLKVATASDLKQKTVPLGDTPVQTLLAPRILTPENSYIMNTILRDVVKRGTGRRALVLERQDLGGKTGTTNDYKDAWFSGFGADITTTAWVGFDQPETLGRGEAGGSAALPIWINYMRVALKDRKQQHLLMPKGIVPRHINKETGAAANQNDENAMEEYFILAHEEKTITLPDEAMVPEQTMEQGMDNESETGTESETSTTPTQPSQQPGSGGLDSLF